VYIPKINHIEDRVEILSFMRRFNFATIITSKDNHPNATHLPFEVEVVNIEAKFKLSQNRSEIEKENIINSLSSSENTNENLIADYMQKQRKKKQ